MNKLLQYMIGAGNVSDKFLPQLTKAQKGFTALPTDLNRYDNIPNPAAVRANAEKLMQFKKAQAAKIAAERQGTITQAAPKRSAASKAWAIATNPMTALSYKAKGLDIPENFERGSRNSLDMALDMVNPFGYVNAAATIPGDVMEGNLASAGLKTATLLPFMSEFRGATKGIIPKLNPYSYQNNLPQNVMYRGIGKAGMEDALQSGVFRANPNVEAVNFPGTNFRASKEFSKAYYSPKFSVADNYGQGFIAEVPRDATTWGNRYKRSDWSQIAQSDIPVNQGRILQKDWLMGYKPVNTQSNIQAFGPNNSNSGLGNYLKSNSYVNPLGTVVDYALGAYKGLRNQYKGLLSGNKRPYFEAFPATEAQKAKVMGMQDEAMADALDFTKNYWYEKGSSDIRPILEDKMRAILPELKMASNQSNLERTIDGVPNPLNPFSNTSDRLIPATSWGKGREGLSQDVIDALTQDRGLIGGINIPDEGLSLTLRNQGRYYKTPKEIANTVVHESGHTAQNFGVLGKMSNEGIRDVNKTWGEVTTKFDPEYNYFTSNPDTELGRRFKNALVEPYETSNPFNSQTWRSSPNELHSELMAGKYNLYKQAMREGMSAEEAMTRATNPLGRELNWLLENKNLNRHFKPSTPHEERLNLLKLLPAMAPVAAGAALSQQKYGGQPCYECGGSVKKYDMGGYYDCPDQEKDPETGKCKAEVVRGREAAAANKAASADMNAWAKQVAAMDKENARQNAAQTAGQLSFDYDWMQSQLDKADKKAAMAQYKQFFQQNPNVFVPDDTSGYNPEQKYIIASKLKQRMSTPMGSKLAQQQFGVDPRYYDLQRIQSEMAPKMGGWNGMRNWLFNVYKQEGGQTVTNPFWEGSYDFKPINQGTVDEIKSEMAGYIQSPLYAQRQAMHPERYIGNNLTYYENPKAFQNSTASAKRSYRLMDLYDQPAQIKNIGKFKDYYDPKKRKTVLNSSNLESVVAHELGHSLFKGETLSSLLDSDYDNSKYWDDLASGTKNKFGTSLNKAEVDKFRDFAYPIHNDDEHYDNRGIGVFANESYADLTGIRHLLYKNGLTKKFGDNINRTIYEKALKNKQIQNDPVFKRMQQKYSPGKIILLNNTIAQNTDAKSDADMAQYGGPILDPRGQWAHPGKVTRIPGSNITMQGVNYPVYGVGSNGQDQMMQPGQEYNFGGASYVDEYPMMQGGGTAYVDSVLNANKNLNWVQRLYPKSTPSIQIPGQRGRSTHFMESGDGRVYPTVVQMPDGSLKYLGEDAFNYADSTKSYIKFPTDSAATWFSQNYKQGTGVLPKNASGGQHGGLDRWFAEKWVDVKTGKACGRQEGESRKGYPACRPSKRVNSQTPKTSSEMSPAEKAKFKASKTSSQRISYNHKRNK